MYGDQLAAIWDLFYQDGRGKDYQAEAEQVTAAIRRRQPAAASLLDVACGTGAHLAGFAKLFDDVEGVDSSPAMISVARSKLPEIPFHIRDMRDFDLRRSFDAVVCLNSGIAYLPSLRAVTAALASMVRHLAPTGVLVVEPWWFPERFIEGYIASDIVRSQGTCVSRVSRTHRCQEDATQMDIHYIVADDSGIRHFTETHQFGLWSRDQYVDVLAEVGCRSEYVSPTLSGYGMFVAHPVRR